MKSHILASAFTSLIALGLFSPAIAVALDGEPYLHDPSTVTFSDGKYYSFGTGTDGILSDDGWTWRPGAVRPNRCAAPDVIKIGDRYLVVYGASGGGLGGGHKADILTYWNKTLDPQSTDFKYTDPVVVASSDGIEDCDAIDPAFLLDPNDGRLYLSYGTFFGFTRLVELDPKTGHRVEGNKPVNIAIDCEATYLLYRDGWYYLLADHGTCCNGATSTYNIVVGRSKKVTGPYLDNMGQDMLKGGGKMVVAASGRFIGPGHFARLILDDGVERFSCHYESDLDRPNHFGVMDIRPLMWKDGWPVAGDNIQKETTRQIKAAGANAPALKPTGEPVGDGAQWTIAPVANAGGYPGSPYFKITLAGGTRALAINANKEVVTVPAFTSAPEQLWRLDQLIDGSWRIMPKAADPKDALVLSANATATTLTKFDFKNATQHWNLKDPTDPTDGNILKEGTFEIQSARSGFALELAVEGARIGGARGARGTRGGTGPVTPTALPDPAQVAATWPAGNIDLRIGDYMLGAHQKWTITPVANTAGAPKYKIVVAGTNRALAATADRDVVTVPSFTGKPEELWTIEKLDDGTYRIAPSSAQDSLVLTAVGFSTPSLVKFDPKSDKSRWNLRVP